MTISGDAIRDELGHYLSRLWRYALVLSHRRDIADDLVQATCLRALERAAQFTPGSHLDRWLFSILHSIWLNEVRAQHLRQGQGCMAAEELGDADGSDEKAALAKQAGAWATINYHKEDIAQRVAELTQGEKVGVVYDSVGKSTWLASLDSLKRRGLMVSFGNASGPVTGVDLALLNQKGSLYVTRPSLNGYITNRAELQYASNELFSLIGSGAIRVEVRDEQKFALADAQRAHQVLESRSTSGSSLLIP